MKDKKKKQSFLKSGIFLLLILSILLVTGCGKDKTGNTDKSASEKNTEDEKPGLVIEDINLDELVAAAKEEGELVVYMTSSRVKGAAALFEEKYGIKVSGTKMKDGEQAERVIREVDADNVQVDVIAPEDGPFVVSTMLPKGYLINWIPKDMMNMLTENDLYPLVHRWQPRVLAYNTEAYPDGSPVKNIWEITEEKWKGKVALQDLSLQPATRAFFAQLALHPEILEKSYEEYYGKKLETKEENASWEFMKRFFSNELVLLGSDGDISEAVGSKGQTAPPVGFITLTKLRDNESKNRSLATCKGLEPFMGYSLATYTMLVKNAPHPNAARLFIRFLLTPEGISPWTKTLGAFSPNPEAYVHPGNEGTWQEWVPKLVFVENDKLKKVNQEVNDFWLLNRN